MFNIPFLQKKSPTDSDTAPQRRNIKLVVGLGNPGEKYENTYHNSGSAFVDFLIAGALSDELGNAPKWKNIKSFRYTKTNDLVIAKPSTFMNKSGEAIKEILRYFRINPEEMLVVHDDSDIKLGEYKFLSGGGSAGHKGVDSIIGSLGTKDFYRLKIGIRKRSGKAEEFVLSKIEQEDSQLFNKVFKEMLEATNLVETS